MCRYVDVVNDTYNNACVGGCEVEGSLKGLASNVVPVAAYVLSVMVDDAQGRETAHIDRALFLQNFAGRHGLVVEGHIGTDRASEDDFVVGSG